MRQNIRNRAAVRSARLQQEARNCIAIAVGKTGGFTADLIDEAVRLNARARELVRGDADHGSRAHEDA